jgi:hypothetical protein
VSVGIRRRSRATRFLRVAQSPAWAIALPLIVATAVYLLIGISAGTPIGRTGDPEALIVPGDQFAAPDLLSDDAYVYPNSTGYDGQLFFYIAQDPFLTGKVATRDEI